MQGETAAQSQEETAGFESSCQAATLPKPQFQRRKGDPHATSQQDKHERCWELSLLYQAQHSMVACGAPQSFSPPPESPKEVPSAAYCLAEVLGYLGGAAACLKVPGHSTEQG